MVKKFKTGILVGKKMIEKMEGVNIKVHYKTLSENEYIEALHNKMAEEIGELKAETSKDGIASELADIIEVIECIKEAYQVNDSDIDLHRNKKIKSKGSYSDRTLTEFLEIEESNPAIDYYLQRPNKYPEID